MIRRFPAYVMPVHPCLASGSESHSTCGDEGGDLNAHAHYPAWSLHAPQQSSVSPVLGITGHVQ